MNFEPPDFTSDVSLGNNRNGGLTQNNKGSNYYQRPNFTDCSPLLRINSSPRQFDKGAPPKIQNRLNSTTSNPPHFKPVYNRLGHRNSYQNNAPDNVQMTSDNATVQRNFNRKRIGEVNAGPVPPKRKWNKKRVPFYQNSNNMNQSINSAQDRLNRIRNNSHLGNDNQTLTQNAYAGPESMSNPNDSQEFDATDITVEVVNSAASRPVEDLNFTRFKMILDAKTQAAIRVIQQKRKDKQVIFPFPVTPNVTAVSLNERFSML